MEKNMPQGDPLVSIRCLVYNHEPYLRQCLDGFVMQQTTFPFEAIVHDDASTDGSAAIIREYAEKYPHIIKPIYETKNQYVHHFGSMIQTIDAAMHPASKYVALCEGDDYWTDPQKLQKQVDIMEADETIGLVHTAARVYIQQTDTYKDRLWGQPIDSFEDELIANRPVTLTTCFRKELYKSARVFFRNHKHNKRWRMGDYPLWLYISYHAKTAFIEKPTGVYRILEHSVSHNTDIHKLVDFEISAFDIRTYFAEYFHHEHLLKRLATNLVYKLQDLSIKHDERVNYDIVGLHKEYGLEDYQKLLFKHYVLKNSFLRTLYLKYLSF